MLLNCNSAKEALALGLDRTDGSIQYKYYKLKKHEKALNSKYLL